MKRKQKKEATMGLNFKLVDLTGYFDELIASHSGPQWANTGGFWGSMHTYVGVGSDGIAKIVNQGIVVAVIGGVQTAQWGPARQDQRDKAYSEPVKEGSYLIEPDGSWGVWVKDKGYVEGSGTKPVAKFSSSGVCTQAGYTPGNVWYNVGDTTEHPSAPPSTVAATNADAENALRTAAVNFAKGLGLK